MPEWEYGIVLLDWANKNRYQLENMLCQMGSMGWELVAIEKQGPYSYAYVKKPKR